MSDAVEAVSTIQQTVKGKTPREIKLRLVLAILMALFILGWMGMYDDDLLLIQMPMQIQCARWFTVMDAGWLGYNVIKARHDPIWEARQIYNNEMHFPAVMVCPNDNSTHRIHHSIRVTITGNFLERQQSQTLRVLIPKLGKILLRTVHLPLN